jgi:hypothetical protein
MTTPADVPVYCCTCGGEFPSPEHEPGDLKPHLVNGLCAECRRLARKPNNQILTENKRLREALTTIGTECTNYYGGVTTCINSGRERGGRYTGANWCHGCIAREALSAR